jgi:hypothetical protein
LQNINLAEAVVEQIKTNEQRAESLKYNLIIVAVLIAGIVSAYFAIDYINPIVLKSVLNFIDAYKWILIFIFVCFAAIEAGDKKLVKRKLVIGH